MEFRCNLKCVHCMIEGTMDRLVPQSLDQFSAGTSRSGEDFFTLYYDPFA